jgi:hypothetical protein
MLMLTIALLVLTLMTQSLQAFATPTVFTTAAELQTAVDSWNSYSALA